MARLGLLLYAMIWGMTMLGVVASYLPLTFFPLAQLVTAFGSVLIPVHLFTYLLYRKKWRYALWILSGMIVSIWVGTYDFQLNHPESPTKDTTIKLASYNVKSFDYQHAKVDSLIDFLKREKVDLLCLQEFRNYQLSNKQYTQKRIAEKLEFPHHYFIKYPSHVQGVAIFSKYPITQLDTLYISKSEVNGGVLATIETDEGSFGIVNFHLSSFRYKATWDDRKKKGWRRTLITIIRDTQKALRLHDDKIQKIMKAVDGYPHPLLLAGDMNSAPFSHSSMQFAGKFKDSFMERGNGLGWTIPIWKGWGVRIDYQFASEEWEICNHKIVRQTLSDHYPIIGTYSITF